MIKDQKCSDCIHFYPNPKDDNQGQCRCNPPQIVLVTKLVEGYNPVTKEIMPQREIAVPQSMFPPMLSKDPGCGKFEMGEKDVV